MRTSNSVIDRLRLWELPQYQRNLVVVRDVDDVPKAKYARLCQHTQGRKNPFAGNLSATELNNALHGWSVARSLPGGKVCNPSTSDVLERLEPI